MKANDINEERLYSWYWRVYRHIAEIADMRIEDEDGKNYQRDRVFIDGMDYGDNKCEGKWGHGHVMHKDMMKIFYEWNNSERSIPSLKLNLFNALINYNT